MLTYTGCLASERRVFSKSGTTQRKHVIHSLRYTRGVESKIPFSDEHAVLMALQSVVSYVIS